MGLLCIVFVFGDSDVESIEAGVDCDFRGYFDHLQSDFPILCDTGYVDCRQRSDYRTGCGFYLCSEIRAIVVRGDKEVSILMSRFAGCAGTSNERKFYESAMPPDLAASIYVHVGLRF